MHSHGSFNDSEYVVSPVYARTQRFSATASAVSSPMRRTGNKIDYTKFKTKMCRNFVNGIPCPFGDLCAFSHGADVDVTSGDDSNSAPSSPAVPLPKSRRGLPDFGAQGLSKDEALKGSYENLTSLGEHSSGDSVASESMGLPPPPPAYDEAVQDETVVVMPETHALVEARPPAYPTRFRYDPYSYDGVLYV